MIWIIIFLVIIMVSLFLAARSMQGFQEEPKEELAYGLFLIRNIRSLDESVIRKLHSFSKSLNAHFSLERLFKGSETVLVMYAPKSVAENFPELDLFELENYLSAENVNESTAWVIQPKNNPKKELITKNGFLKMLDLTPDQKFFWQIVLNSENTEDFQVTLRAVVLEKDAHKRIELAKKIDKEISDSTGLIKQVREQSSSSIFEDYEKRKIFPRQAQKFMLNPLEILKLLAN